MFRPPGDCPICGEDVPARAAACPGCGADKDSGWKDGAEFQGAIPDDEFDYDEFVAEEFGKGKPKNRIRPIWWITALILLILFAAGYFL